jgi:hypothetical protein
LIKRKNNSNYDTNSRELLFRSEAVFFFWGGGQIFTPQQQKKIQCKVLGVGFWKKCAKVAIFKKMCSWRLPKQSEFLNQMSILLADL